MKFAIALPQSNRVSSPTGIRDVARAGDELGFWALSMGDHITFDGRWISCGSDSDNGTADVRNIYEPLTTYAHVAALSERVRLLFSIMLLPTREPLVTAKQLATPDRLSGGRVLLGLGVGLAGDDTDPPFVSLLSANVAREWEALRVPVSRRGRLTDERLAAMRALWTDDSASFAGNLVSFTDVELFPKPLAAGRHPDPRGRQLPGSTRPDRPRRIHVAAQSCEPRRGRRRHRLPAAAPHCARHGVLGGGRARSVHATRRHRERRRVGSPPGAEGRLGVELADRNLLGNAGDLVARSDSRSTTATTSC